MSADDVSEMVGTSPTMLRKVYKHWIKKPKTALTKCKLMFGKEKA